MKIRFKKILQFLVFGKGGTVYYLTSIIIVILYVLFASQTDFWLHSYFGIITISIITPAFFYLAYNQLLYWIKNKSELFLFENFLFLMLFGFYVSILFGSLDYAIYKSNPNDYILSKDYTSSLIKTDVPRIQNKIDKTKDLILDLREINKLIKHNDSLLYDKNKTWLTNSPDILIKYLYMPPHIGSTEYHELQVVYKGEKYFIFNHYQNNDIRVFNCFNKSFKSDVIKDIIEQKIGIEEKYRIQLESEISNLSISLSLFIYSKLVSSLSFDIGLYKASSTLSRILELLFALFRFVYFGFIIALILDSWKKSAANNA